MKIFCAAIPLLLALSAFGQGHISKQHRPETQCHGVIHGVVIGQDGEPFGGVTLILEPAGDYNYVLPETKTDQKGEYRFERVCGGKWGVFVRDKDVGYPQSGRQLYRFLYGRWSPHVKITNVNLDVKFDVNVPPKPGILIVRAIDSKTKSKITNLEVELKVNRERDATFPCKGLGMSSCESDPALVPPNKDVKLHVKSEGFYEWKASAGRGKVIHLLPGEVMTLDVELDPIQK